MDAIKYSKLIDVGHFYGGLSGKTKDDFEDGNAKFITYMNVFSNPSLKTNVDDRVRIKEGEKQNVVEYGDVIFTGSSETPDECGMSSVLEEHTDEPLYLNSFSFGYRFNDIQAVFPAFFKHLFRSNTVRAKIAKTANGVTRFNVSKKLFGEIEIPIPTIAIQQKIATQLDSFTSLITNLETELASRQKQYEYYRNKLLTFDEADESVEWKTLGEIGTMYKGKGIQKADFVEKGMPCIHYGQLHTYYGFSATETKSFVSEEMYSTSNKAKKGDLIIATTSEDVEACCKSTVWLGEEEPAISGDSHYFRHNQNPKYIGYLFMTEMFATQKRTAAVGAKVTRVHGESILKFKLPIPSLQYQNDTVDKLDTFESLISNIKQELDARKKQYEYYREKLLTFE